MVWLVWLERRLRPPGGWVSLLLLVGVAYVALAAVAAVDWTPEAPVAIRLSAAGLILASLLAQRPVDRRLAWALISVYGLVLTALALGRLWPPVATVNAGWPAVSALVRQNAALAVDRIAGWIRAVTADQATTETLVFTIGLALAGWLLMAYAAWGIFRQRRPLPPLTLIGLALAVNGYFGGAPLWPAALFVGLAAMLIAVVHFAAIEQSWQQRGVDYSGEIWRDLLGVSSAAALLLLAGSLTVPTINLRALSERFLEQPAVMEAEETLGRVFAGVQVRPRPVSGAGLVGGSGLPQSFLLGNPPELSETVVMTAVVSGTVPPGVHWRGRSFDVYTGRGWATSEERREPFDAGAQIPLPEAAARQSITQTVNWAPGDSAARYTLGFPLEFDQAVEVYWRGVSDLNRVRGVNPLYQARSLVSVASPEALRQAALADTPPAILARYTRLPEDIPQRVLDLAHQAAGYSAAGQSPYDQARALERFLRQYPYSLEVPLPPAESDPVDYFLFELQSGYCDYYASAMVVMARALGLPARLAIGYLAQPADAQGRQTIFQINAHSWAEIYLAGYGWIEFEPTASFPVRDAGLPGGEEGDPFGASDPMPPPPAVVEHPARPGPRLWLLLPAAAAVVAALWWWRRRQRRVALDELSRAYASLQQSARRLGLTVKPSQTPAEFAAALGAALLALQEQAGLDRLQPAALADDVGEISAAFAVRQYRRPQGSPQDMPAALQGWGWRRRRLRLWFLATLQRLRPT